MNLKVIPVGKIETNCIVYYSCNDGVIIDPGDDGDVILGYLKDNNITVSKILLTHGHFDHIAACDSLREHLKIPALIYENDKSLAQSADVNGSKSWLLPPVTAEIDETLSDGQIIGFDGFNLKVIHTPGHTKGSCCFYDETNKTLFSGDTLFNRSIGRTDFPTGDFGEIIHSINNKLLMLPEDVIIYPGHGPETTVKIEKISNPFIK